MADLKYTIPRPPKEIFEYADKTLEWKVLNENRVVMNVKEVDFTNGIQVWYEGCDTPRKGFPYPEATIAMNLCKRVLMEGLRLPKLAFLRPEKLIRSYLNVCFREISPHILSEEYMTPCAKEIKKFVFMFLYSLGINIDVSLDFARVFSTIFEYDDAYRFRVQDLLTETCKEELMKPRKVIARLLKLLKEREKYDAVPGKFLLISRFLTLGLYIPKVRKAYTKALNMSRFQNFQFDETDRFWMQYRKDYDFFGKSYEERRKDAPKLKGYEISI